MDNNILDLLFREFPITIIINNNFDAGRLCNGFIEKLIDSVLQLQDISENTATQLTNVFTIVSTNMPSLFPVRTIFNFIE